MPKDEFDFEDPLELNGVAIYTEEDTQREMADCFIEEFLMLGHTHGQILALFRNPHYLGMNMVLQNKGESFVKDAISEVCARWGRKIEWSKTGSVPPESQKSSLESPGSSAFAERNEFDEISTDPLGNPIPKLNI